MKKSSLFLTTLLLIITGCPLFRDDARINEGTQISNTEVFLPLGFMGGPYATPKVSPDGTMIIFEDYGLLSEGVWIDSMPGLYIFDLATYQKRMLLGSGHNPDWSPDSKWIVYTGGGGIYKIQTNGDGFAQLNTTGVSPAWSPKGDVILYGVFDSVGTWFMQTDGSNQRLVTTIPVGIWYPSGLKLLGSTEILPDFKRVFIVYDIQTNSAIDTLDATNDLDNTPVQYSPDGTRILFTNDKGIWVMNSDGTNVRNVMSRNSELFINSPSWFPDSKNIAYYHFRITRTMWTAFGTLYEGYASLYRLAVD